MEYALSIKEFINQAGTKGPLLGIDHGTKRIGVSISDPEREFTFPLIVVGGQNVEESAISIVKIIKEKAIKGLVIGYPLQLDGQESPQCKIIKNFAKAILQNIQIPIFFQDERFSTKGAQTMLKELDLTRAQVERKDDMLSACNILQTALQRFTNH